ncbi:sensor histidine kinase [Actinomadura rudentiformis]|uniref:histidine kinase n=1 Tax=Actinomadura rudentiformis TaxID=359158 RepID=A0A6H9YE85_9ACTN|nr:ATP-binding protein [Actinomadura rudentiformis]KAB2344081.1 HAMP domain-containing protein [Actinomadura rudentiformis]
MRLLPRSIRGRDTVISAVVAVLVLSALAAAADVLLRNMLTQGALEDAQFVARQASAAVREGTLGNPIQEDANGAALVQLVSPEGRVLKASVKAAGQPPLADLRPRPESRVQAVTTCLDDECYAVWAIRVTTAPDSPTVYGAGRLPWVMTSGLLELLLALTVLALAALVAWTTWQVVGRTLRPVEEIRLQLAEISGSDLARRVPEPPGADEIAHLARTANETLDRLEKSVTRQRQFASDAAHELRTPITGLRVNLEDLAMYPDDTDIPAATQAALRATDRLESIVADLLLLARIGTGAAVQEEIDLAELVRAEVATRTGSADVRTRLTPGLTVTGVRLQLARLLGNLLDNAERHTKQTIDVEVGRDNEDFGLASLIVADDGPGIPREDRERVFDRFTRLDPARSRGSGGAGLGLAIARDIALAHGGSLRIEDSQQGARFVLRLPLL